MLDDTLKAQNQPRDMYTERTGHSHSVDIGSFTSGAPTSTAHTHSTDLATFNTASGGSHAHTATLTGTTATARTGDVMPYVQRLVCRKK